MCILLNFINMKTFIKENFYLFILWILCGICLYMSVGHYNNIMLDVGREVYYPEQILNGKILYKDLFVIYGPFAYLFNAILFKIFGIKLSTLYFSGICSSLALISGVYLLGKKFLDKFLCFSIGLLTIVVGVFTNILHNFTFPYSWDILYGTVAFIFAVLFLIKYEQSKKNFFLYISTFLTGICISCKYEFVIPAFLLFCYLIYICTKDIKKGLKALGYFFIAPVICFGTLFVQGLKIEDLISSFQNVKAISQAQTLKYFYQTVGASFHPKLIPIILTTFLKTSVSLGILYTGIFLKEKNKIASFFVTFLGLLISLWFLTDTKIITLTFLPLLLIITSIICYKKFKNNIPLLIIVISAVCISIKTVYAMMVLSYPSYYFFIVLIAFLALLFNCIDKKYQNITGIYILMFALCIMFINSIQRNNLNEIVSTSRGAVSTFKNNAKSTNELISFISDNTNKNDKIVILPEGLMINFLTDRKSDDYFNSILPLYIESFGEDKIIQHFENNKPDYFVLSNENMSNYGFQCICEDYALEFCSFINSNYNHIKTIDNGYRYLVFRKK